MSASLARLATVLLAAAALLAAPKASATVPLVPIPVYGTGIGLDGSKLPDGEVDPHYTFTRRMGQFGFPTPPRETYVVANRPAGWRPNPGGAKWISHHPDQGENPPVCPPAGSTYRYITTFDLSGLDPSTAVLNVAWSADNIGGAILLNGGGTGGSAPGPVEIARSTISQGFVAGVNTLEFEVFDVQCPTGLIAEIVGTALPQLAQVITFAPQMERSVGEMPFKLDAFVTSGEAITFTSQTPAVCTVSGSTASLLSAGTCTIAADAPSAPQVTRSFPVRALLDPRDSTDVAVGEAQECGVTRTGGVRCTGYTNYWGEQGIGSTPGPDVVGLQAPVASVVAGWYHTCALMVDGGVKCWGWNERGQIGAGGALVNSACPIDEFYSNCALSPVDVPGVRGITALAAGAEHTCALRNDGRVLCWGANSNGQSAGGDQFSGSTSPSVVPGIGGTGELSGVVSIGAGPKHTCAVLASGDVVCWGLNTYNQLGVDNAGLQSCELGPCSRVPTMAQPVPGGAARLGASGWWTCAVSRAGALWCWGNPLDGRVCGAGQAPCPIVPFNKLGLGGGVVRVAGGDSQGCALLANGGLRCWNAIDNIGFSGFIAGVAAGRGNVCALTSSGGLACSLSRREAPPIPVGFEGIDQAPDPFSSGKVVLIDTVTTSEPMVLQGFYDPAPVSITNGEYSIGCTATFTAATGTLSPGQSVCVRHTASSQHATQTTTTLTVGGVPVTFTSTTQTAPNLVPIPPSTQFPFVYFLDAQAVGTTSRPMHIDLQNQGEASATFLIGVEGDFAASEQQCQHPLPGGATCRIALIFTPVSPGGRWGQLNVYWGGEASIDLYGVGAASDPTPDPLAIEFATTTLSVGETGANGTLTLTRSGSTATAATVTYTTVAGTATAALDFTQTTGTVAWAAGDASPKTIAVGPNVVAAPFIRILNDAVIESPETFTVVLSAPTGGGVLGTNTVATVTINSEDAGIAMATANLKVVEGAGTVDVIVNRAGSTLGAVSVNYATSNYTGTAPAHYTATSGTLNWADGDATPKTITVPIIDNTAVNATRSFYVDISGAAGAALGTPTRTTVTIADDDNTLQFTTAASTVTEGTPNLVLTVSRLGGTAGTASVTWTTANGTATSGSDFGTLGVQGNVTGTLEWAAGDATSRTITIPFLNDAVIESTEKFSVVLSAPVGTGVSLGAVTTNTVTVNDDEASLNMAQAAYSVIEGGANATVTVTRSGAATSAVSVTWTTANGTATAGQDFGTLGSATQRTGKLSWAAGDTAPKSITVGSAFPIIPVINDTTFEGDETFTITLSSPTGGALLGPTSVATVTIVDNESSFQFSPATASVSETGANSSLTVTRTGSFATAATITFTTANGTAAAASDFTQTTGTLSWAAGDGAPKTLSVGPVASPAPHIPVLNDAVIESPETFTVALSAPTGGAVLGATPVATVTITSEDSGIAMAAATQSVAEAGGSVVVNVNRAGATTGAVSVNYATVNGTALAGTHYTLTNGTLNWAAGDGTPKTITVPIADNTAVNTNRSFNVTLSGPVGAALGTPATTTVTIGDDDNTLQFTAPTATVAEGVASLVLTVSRLGGAAGAASVTWTTANGTALSGTDFGAAGVPADVTGSLNWAAGDAASKTVTIPILNDLLVEGAKTFTVTLSAPTGTGAAIGATPAVKVTLNDNDAGVVLSSASYLVNENTASITLTVNRIGPTTAAANVTWTTANGSATSGADFGLAGNAAHRTGTLVWAAGDATAKAIVINILNDAVAEGTETFTVTLSNPSAGIVLGTPATATVTILDDETPPLSTVQFSVAKTVVVEGSGPAVLSVTRTGSDFTYPVSVNFGMAAGSALSGSDYTASTGTLTWSAGDSTPKTITIPITNDAVAENPEQFTVTLSALTPGAGLGAPATATVAVIDDDEAFPFDGGIPAGWVVPGGAAGGWHVNNEPGAFEGVYSLKSDLINDGENAQIQVTGNYLAGTLTFRVKVSSEPNFDVLRFYIDGVQAGQWSGTANTAWQLFSVAVPAGAHTFRWSYEKDGEESFGFDAAWIDAVVLPPVGP